MHIDKMFILGLFILVHFSLQAQSFKIKGRVLDENKEAIEFSNVQLLNEKSEVVYSTYSDNLGFFEIDSEKGNYFLKIEIFSNILFERTIFLESDIDLKDIFVEKSFLLEDILIKSKVNNIQRKIDKVVFNVDGVNAFIGSDAVEILKKLPGIKVINNSLVMNGKDGINIRVNGKEISLSKEDTIAFLNTLSYDQISKIEVISNPSALFDAEGNSGVLNIILKTSKEDTWDGSISSNFQKGKFAKENIGGVYNYQKKHLTISTSLNYDFGKREVLDSSVIFYANEEWNTISPVKSRSNSISPRVIIDYKLFKYWNIGIQYLGNYSDKNSITDTNVDINYISIVKPKKIISTLNNEESDKRLTNLSFYNRFFINENDDKYLDIGFDYLFSSFNQQSTLKSEENMFYKDKIEQEGVILNNGGQNVKNFAGKIDFSLPNNVLNIKTGGKFLNTYNKSDFSVYSSILNKKESDVFIVKDKIYALYFSGSKELFSDLEIQTGLRMEYSSSENSSEFSEKTFSYNYLEFFPSLYIKYSFNGLHELALNYSRRINRPSYRDLNPFRIYETEYSFIEGNPLLLPSFSNNIELNFLYQNKIDFRFYFSKLKNGIDQVTIVSNDSTKQQTIPLNYINSDSYGFFITYTFDKIEWWASNNSIDFSYSNSFSSSNLTNNNLSGFGASFSTLNDFFLNKNKTMSLSLNYSYSTSSVYGMNEYSPYSYLDIAFKLSMLKKQVQLSISGYDLLKTNITTMTSYSNNLKQQYRNYYDTRNVKIALVYKFGSSSIKGLADKSINSEEQSRL